MNMKPVFITERISYLPATEEPLCADVVVIAGAEFNWIYDVGSSAEAAEFVSALPGRKNVIISHFHGDHTANLNRIAYDNLYCGDFSAAKLGKGISVTSALSIDDGVRLDIFPLASTHSKGALGLQVDGKIAFIGDAVYSQVKGGRAVYNVNTLKQMISVLERLEAERFALSHSEGFIHSKNDVIRSLRELYSSRKPGESYISECQSERKEEK